MKIIDIPATDKTPQVVLDSDNKVLQLKGNCLPENVRDFSNQVISKVENYLTSITPEPESKNISGALRVHFRMGYFNSAAAKFLADLIVLCGSYIQKNVNIKLYWYFDEDDHDMLEAGEEISHMVNIPMEYIAVIKGV